MPSVGLFLKLPNEHSKIPENSERQPLSLSHSSSRRKDGEKYYKNGGRAEEIVTYLMKLDKSYDS